MSMSSATKTFAVQLMEMAARDSDAVRGKTILDYSMSRVLEATAPIADEDLVFYSFHFNARVRGSRESIFGTCNVFVRNGEFKGECELNVRGLEYQKYQVFHSQVVDDEHVIVSHEDIDTSRWFSSR